MKLFRIRRPEENEIAEQDALFIAAHDEWEALDIVERDKPELLAGDPPLKLADLYVDEYGDAPTGTAFGVVIGLNMEKLKLPEKKSGARSQQLRDVKTSKDYSDGTSPYWDYMAKSSHANDDGTVAENPLANPDVLSDERGPFNRPLSAEGREQLETIDEVFTTLPPQQRLVAELCITQGWSEEEVATKLGISRRAVNLYLNRVREKVRKAHQKNKES